MPVHSRSQLLTRYVSWRRSCLSHSKHILTDTAWRFRGYCKHLLSLQNLAERQLSTMVFVVEGPVFLLYGRFPLHYKQFFRVVIFVPRRLLNKRFILIYESISKQFSYSLYHSYVGDVRREFEFSQENRLFLTWLLVLVSFHGLWRSCAVLFSVVTQFRLLNRVGSGVFLSIWDIQGAHNVLERFENLLEKIILSHLAVTIHNMLEVL